MCLTGDLSFSPPQISLQKVIRGGKTACQLRAVRMAMLRMRNHAGTLDAAGDLVEQMVANFRAACARYVDVVENGRVTIPASRHEPNESESDLEEKMSGSN